MISVNPSGTRSSPDGASAMARAATAARREVPVGEQRPLEHRRAGGGEVYDDHPGRRKRDEEVDPDLAAHADVKRAYPAIAHAADEVGTPQIRNVGTVGGNLNQRPRCWYFRNEEFNCLKKGGSRCFAVNGENQYHAIFGDGPCHIVHPSSLAVPAVALNARFRVVGPAGEREIAAGDYYQMPDRNLFGETALAPNEILTHVLLPAPGTSKNATYEVRYKQSHDWPLATWA